MSLFTHKRAVSLCLTLVMTAGVVGATLLPGARAIASTTKTAIQSGVTVLSNAKAAVDTSNLSEGFLMLKYTGGKQVRIKVQITKSSGTTYTYNLNHAGHYETFPLTEGNGSYTIKVYENTTGTKYAQAYSTSVTLNLRSPFLPFLYPNQYVNYNEKSTVVAKGKEIVKAANATSDLERIQAIFNWVTKNLTYNYELAKNPPVGYLPDVDQVLSAKKGICFDYSAVMAAMLRSQDIPCKLVVGYAGTVYHAWLDIYIEGVGWVSRVIYFDGKDWTLMDPTFVSNGKGSAQIMKYVTTPSNYTQKYAY